MVNVRQLLPWTAMSRAPLSVIKIVGSAWAQDAVSGACPGSDAFDVDDLASRLACCTRGFVLVTRLGAFVLISVRYVDSHFIFDLRGLESVSEAPGRPTPSLRDVSRRPGD